MPNEIFNITSDEELVTYRRRRQRDFKAPFLIVGNGMVNRHGKSMNTLKMLLSLSPGPAKLFLAMVEARDVDSNTVHRTSILNEELNARHLDNHMPALVEAGLVRRMKRGMYMINPWAVMPPNGHDAREAWAGLSRAEESSENTTATTPVTG